MRESGNLTLKKENREVVEHLARGGALDDFMMDELLAVNDADPDLAKWYVAAIGIHLDPFFNHAYTLPVPLAREQFGRLCLLGLHRIAAESGLIPAAEDEPSVHDLLLKTAKAASPERTVGLYCARQYLAHTPARLGMIAAERLLARKGDLKSLTIEEWMTMRHEAEKIYMGEFAADGELSLSWFARVCGQGGLLGAARYAAGAGHPPARKAAGMSSAEAP